MYIYISYTHAFVLVHIYKYKEKIVILQSIGIIVIKSKEIRVVGDGLVWPNQQYLEILGMAHHKSCSVKPRKYRSIHHVNI